MARTSAEADLDAARNKKPDTSEADALRKELQTLEDQHQVALITAQQESAKATEQYLAVKTSLAMAKAELKQEKQDNELKSKAASDDYLDMHNSLTELKEEAQKKYADSEARLKEAEASLKVKDAEIAEAKVCLCPYRLQSCTLIRTSLQARITAASSPNTPKGVTNAPSGLSASRFAEDIGSAPSVEEEAAEGEPDSSSAALASVREPSPNA